MPFIRKDMQSRAHHVADRIDRLLMQIGEEVQGDGWDGRELLTGIGVSLGRACSQLKITPAQAIDMVNRLDLGQEAPRETSLLVAPNGRPLVAPPRRVK